MTRTQPLRLRPGQLLLPKLLECRRRCQTQVVWRNGIDQASGRGPPNDNAVLTDDMALNDPVTSMSGHLDLPVAPDGGMIGMVRIITSECGTRNIRSF